MASKKIDKEFLITDSSVNCYGYRLMTEGYLMDRFNPSIGYLMHSRADGVAVKWTDFRKEGDKVYAKPVINEEQFPNLASQIEEGFYNAASVGHIVALEVSDDEALKLDGQTGPTVTKWFNRECSIVDVPGNFNAIALAKLYANDDSVLRDLSSPDINNQNFKEVDKIVLPAIVFAELNLSADAKQADFNKAFVDLAAKAAKVTKLETENASLKQELSNLKANEGADKVKNIIEKGLADRKLTKEIADKLSVDYKDNPAGLENLVAAMPAQSLVTGKNSSYPEGLPDKYKGKTFASLYASNELEDLQRDFPEYYKQLKENK